VEAVTLKISDSTGETIKVLADSQLNKDATLQKEIPFIKTGKTYVGLIPSVKHKNQVVPCPDPAIELDDIPSC
jgi:hypothetical protein